MSQLETSLKELAEAEFDRLETAYPDEKGLLAKLRATVLTGLSQNAADVEALEGFIDSIQDEGGKLDVSGWVYSDLFDFQDALRKRIREVLSRGDNGFPQLAVQLKAAASAKGRTPAVPKKDGERTKLGGLPDWIQGEETPICKRCKQPMTFVGQIDSIGAAETALGRTLAKKRAFVFADCGMIYVFWCKGCNETHAILQSH